MFDGPLEGYAVIALAVGGGFEGLDFWRRSFSDSRTFVSTMAAMVFGVGVSLEVRRESVSSALSSRRCFVRTRCRLSAVALWLYCVM